jgi:hypothetical protein
MRRLCPFCLKPIAPKETVVKLVIGLVHEKCALRRQRDSFQEEFKKISQFPKKSTLLQRMSNQLTLMLENIIDRGLNGDEHKEFCNEWSIINRTILEFDTDWWIARHYIAQKNAIDRFLSGLKGRPFIMPRTQTESKKSNLLMRKILATVTNYSLASIDETFRFKKEKIKPKPKEEYIVELKELVTKFDTTIKTMLRKAKKDHQKYSKILNEDRKIWLQQNFLKLNEYGLLPEF